MVTRLPENTEFVLMTACPADTAALHPQEDSPLASAPSAHASEDDSGFSDDETAIAMVAATSVTIAHSQLPVRGLGGGRAFAPNLPAAMQCLSPPSWPSGLERIDLEPPRAALLGPAGFESIGTDNGCPSRELLASTPPPANKHRPIARKAPNAKHPRQHDQRQHYQEQNKKRRKCPKTTTFTCSPGSPITSSKSTEQVRSSQDRHGDLWDLGRDVALLASVQRHGAPEHGSLTNAHPLVATAPPLAVPEPTLSPLVLVTFQTRSRETVQRLQKEAAKANRRYVPPARGLHQHITCPTTPPATQAALERLDQCAALRIGDTIECRFTPKTPFEQICRGTEIPSRDQVALAFETRYAEGSDKAAVVRQLEFEVFYYSFDDGLVCLRCQHAPAACSCGYASDLLEINRDWKLKHDPSRRLGLRRATDGSVTVALFPDPADQAATHRGRGLGGP